MKELNRMLKQLTSSKNYAIEQDCGYRFYYTGKNIPCGCKPFGREQLFMQSDLNTFKHELITLIKFRKFTTINMKDYIDRMSYLFEQTMCHLAYGYSFENSRYIGEINLPYNLKRDVFYYVKSLIQNRQSNVYTDSEGCSYNSMSLVKA